MSNDNADGKIRVELIRYARVMIIIAIGFLAFGLYLDSGSERKLIDPKLGVKKNGKKGDITTIIDIHDWDDGFSEISIESETKDDSSSPSSTPDTGSVVNVPIVGGGGSDSGVGSSVIIGGFENSRIPGNASVGSGGSTVSPSPSPSSPPAPSLDDINNELRDSIQNNYGITVKYGYETSGYTVGGLGTNPIASPSTANTSLNKLNSALALYPNGFFREIKNGGIPLTIYLIDSYSEYGVTGVTDSSYSFANISVAVAYPFEDTFYHESYHYIERYIFKQGIYFSSWSGYNPPGFNYGSLLRDQSFSRTGAADAYFVNDYAQTTEEEDRASTFEYMMRASKVACLNRNQPVWRKAKNMSEAIDAALNTVSPNAVEYWERHL